MTLNTACSSSLVAFHLACQSLQRGESSLAIVGGTNLILSADAMIPMAAMHVLSPDYRCHTFDKSANGYARGEGIYSMILKPLSAALRDNTIRAIVRGTALNQDGKTPGITLPSTDAQIALINTAYRNARLDFKDTAYFEAHGTGTAAGDVVEATALGATIGKSRSSCQPLLIGSAKSNIGHLEETAGLVGVIKAVYSLEKAIVAPVFGFEKAPSQIRLEEWNLKVPTKLTPWPVTGTRRISVNGFGYGGANAHCILDDAYNYLKDHGFEGNHNSASAQSPDSSPRSIDSALGLSTERIESHESSNLEGDLSPAVIPLAAKKGPEKGIQIPKILIWSSNDQDGIDRMASALHGYLLGKIEAGIDDSLLDCLAYTLGLRRSILAWRSYAVGSSIEEIVSNLFKAPIRPVRAYTSGDIGMIFTGQGAQWFAMGRELNVYEVFWQSMLAADAYLKGLGADWSVVEEFSKAEDDTRVNHAEFSQPMCTILQVALVELLEH